MNRSKPKCRIAAPKAATIASGPSNWASVKAKAASIPASVTGRQLSAAPCDNSATKKLADGTLRTYWYAWRGGPRLAGQPGSKEFKASYDRAVVAYPKPAAGDLLSLMNAYQRSTEFSDLGERTRADYVKQIRKIEGKFGNLPIKGCRPPEGCSKAGATISRSHPVDRRTMPGRARPRPVMGKGSELDRCEPVREEGGRIYTGGRRDKIWTEADEAPESPGARPARRRGSSG
jgi:hypothetical protein